MARSLLFGYDFHRGELVFGWNKQEFMSAVDGTGRGTYHLLCCRFCYPFSKRLA